MTRRYRCWPPSAAQLMTAAGGGRRVWRDAGRVRGRGRGAGGAGRGQSRPGHCEQERAATVRALGPGRRRSNGARDCSPHDRSRPAPWASRGPFIAGLLPTRSIRFSPCFNRSTWRPRRFRSFRTRRRYLTPPIPARRGRCLPGSSRGRSNSSRRSKGCTGPVRGRFSKIGPDSKLTALVRAILEGQDHHAMAVDASRGALGNLEDLACTLASLAAHGYAVQLAGWDGEHVPAATKRPGLTVKVCGANPRPKASIPAEPAVCGQSRGAGPISGSNGTVVPPSRLPAAALNHTRVSSNGGPLNHPEIDRTMNSPEGSNAPHANGQDRPHSRTRVTGVENHVAPPASEAPPAAGVVAALAACAAEPCGRLSAWRSKPPRSTGSSWRDRRRRSKRS